MSASNNSNSLLATRRNFLEQVFKINKTNKTKKAEIKKISTFPLKVLTPHTALTFSFENQTILFEADEQGVRAKNIQTNCYYQLELEREGVVSLLIPSHADITQYLSHITGLFTNSVQ